MTTDRETGLAMSSFSSDHADRAIGRPIERRAFLRIAAALGAATLGLAAAPPIGYAAPALDGVHAARVAWKHAVASAYGPGLYGRRTAAGHVLTASTVGVAHRSLPLGTLLELSIFGRPTVLARVIDRGPYGRASTLDLTEATIRRMGFSSARAFGVRPVVWRYA
jgi:rare lipoprotein A (peptidoglycan hydrolase)